MLVFVDDADRRPVYQQIRDQIVEAIARGALPEGSRLPTTRQLAQDLAINFHTVNKAYDLLRQEGFLRLSRKTGAFVHLSARGEPPEWRRSLRTVLAEGAAAGMADGEMMEICRDVLAGFRSEARAGGGSTA